MIRNTAVQQLADVQKQHPDDLFNLLARVIPYLRSKSWDTRTAAAKAVGGIVENAEKFDPNAGDEPVKAEDGQAGANGSSVKKDEPDSPGTSDDLLQLETLDVSLILTHGKKLLGSAGREYDYKLAAMDPAERLALQKRSLTARLGLGGEYMEEDLVTESDILVPISKPNVPPTPGMRLDTTVSRTNSLSSPSCSAILSPHDPSVQTPGGENGLSKRQINALKRKNKKEFKDQAKKVRVIDLGPRRTSMETPQTPLSAHPHPVRTSIKTEDGESTPVDYFSLERQNGDDDSKVVSEFKGMPVPEKATFQTEAEEQGFEWPYDRLCEFLTVDLFDNSWEIRHGAAMGLREVIRVHGAGAGRRRGKPRAENDRLNRQWLDDLACRFCCVFMLDRFGDYVSDTVVAPIRETAGQALGAVLQYLPPDDVKAAYRVLHRLVLQKDLGLKHRVWEACHGGMIGMRYLVAVRNELLIQDSELMEGVLEAVMKGLGDSDDDVRAVSAATLIPVAEEFVTSHPSALENLITIVWDCLSNLSDDLSASTGSVMDLLAKLCSFPPVLDAMKRNAAENPEHSFSELVPRLYPFLRHTITSVRSAVLRALLTFLDIDGEGTNGWVTGKALRLIFQNLIVERNEGVLKLSLQVWNALVDVLASGPVSFAAEFESHVDAAVSLTIFPIGVSRHPLPMDPWLFMRPSGQRYSLPSQPTKKSSPGPEPGKRRRKSEKRDRDMPPPSSNSHNIDAAVMQGDVDLVGADVLMRCRIHAAQALGKAIACWPAASRKQTFGDKILSGLTSPFSTTQLIAAMVAEEFAKATREKDELATAILGELTNTVEGERPTAYSDLVSYLQVVRAQCQSLITVFRDVAHLQSSHIPTIAVVVQGEPDASKYAFSLADGEKIVGADFDKLKKALTPAQRITSTKALEDARADVQRAIEEARRVKEQHDFRVMAAAAAGIVALRAVPKKPSMTIKAMMDSVKKEENFDLQKRLAAAVAGLVDQMSAAGKRGVVDKVVGNLVKFCCMETAETPEFHANAAVEIGILSLKKEEDIKDHPDAARFEREARAARITRRGAKEALEQLASKFGETLFERIPILRSLIEQPIQSVFAGELPADLTNPENALGQEAVDALSTLRALAPKFHPGLRSFLSGLLPVIAKALKSQMSVLRYAAAKCYATLCSVITVEAITMLVETVLPSINNALDVHCRQGAIECLYHLIHVMADGILPYVIFLIVPVLGRMSDSDNDVRLIATTTFATLVKLVPLEAGIPDPPGLSEELLKGRDRERKFIAQMLDARKVEPFEIPVAIKAELRSYQQEGVNWLAFLNRYNLHGVLCDDMGLGKTLQTLCIVASDHHMRAEEFAKTQAPEARRLPSLIVCPPDALRSLAAGDPYLRSVPECRGVRGPAVRTVQAPREAGYSGRRHHVVRHLQERH